MIVKGISNIKRCGRTTFFTVQLEPKGFVDNLLMRKPVSVDCFVDADCPVEDWVYIDDGSGNSRLSIGGADFLAGRAVRQICRKNNFEDILINMDYKV